MSAEALDSSPLLIRPAWTKFWPKPGTNWTPKQWVLCYFFSHHHLIPFLSVWLVDFPIIHQRGVTWLHFITCVCLAFFPPLKPAPFLLVVFWFSILVRCCTSDVSMLHDKAGVISLLTVLGHTSIHMLIVDSWDTWESGLSLGFTLRPNRQENVTKCQFP